MFKYINTVFSNQAFIICTTFPSSHSNIVGGYSSSFHPLCIIMSVTNWRAAKKSNFIVQLISRHGRRINRRYIGHVYLWPRCSSSTARNSIYAQWKIGQIGFYWIRCVRADTECVPSVQCFLLLNRESEHEARFCYRNFLASDWTRNIFEKITTFLSADFHIFRSARQFRCFNLAIASF